MVSVLSKFGARRPPPESSLTTPLLPSSTSPDTSSSSKLRALSSKLRPKQKEPFEFDPITNTLSYLHKKKLTERYPTSEELVDHLNELLRNYTDLAEIDLCKCPFIEDHRILSLLERHPNVTITFKRYKGVVCYKKSTETLILSGYSSVVEIQQLLNNLPVDIQQIKKLDLCGCREIDPEAFKFLLNKCDETTLAKIYLCNCFKLTDDSLDLIIEKFKVNYEKFKGIALSGNSSYSKEKVQELFMKCTGLTEIYLRDDCEIFTDDSIKQLLDRSRSVTMLSLTNCQKITGENLKDLENTVWNNIMGLEINNCENLNPKALSVILQNCIKLEQLILKKVKKLDFDITIEAIKNNNESLTKVDLTGTTFERLNSNDSLLIDRMKRDPRFFFDGIGRIFQVPNRC